MTTPNPTTIPHGYYAVPDPEQPDTITLWRSCQRTRHGITFDTLDPYPKGAKYGPRLLRRDVPKLRPERDQVREAFWARRTQWEQKIRELIAGDLDTARARFAGDTVRCYECGRVLTDDTSKRLGIGPECRRPPGPHYNDEEIRGAIRDAVETTKPGDTARTWTWTRPIQGRARARETVTVSLRPDYQPKRDATGGSATCTSVLDRLNSGRPRCTDPVVWRIEKRAGSRISISYWCDADMPADYRPDTAPAPSAEQGALFEELAR